MKARDIMAQPARTAPESAPLSEVARLMVDEELEAVPIVRDDGTLAGLITDEDMIPSSAALPFSREELPMLFGHWISGSKIEEEYAAAGARKSSEVMHRAPAAVDEDEPVSAVVDLMRTRRAKIVPVTRAGVPVGMIGPRELLRLVAAER